MKENQENNQEPKQEENKQEENKDYKTLPAVLLAGLTAGLILFMVFGISSINLDKDVKKADLLVEEESYKEAIDIYDRVLSSKNSPEVKEKRDIAMNLMYPDGKPEDPKKDDKESADKGDKKDKQDKEDKKEEDETDAAEEAEETDDQEEDEKQDSLDLDLPMKSVWAPRANIRSQPSESASVVGVITKGTEIYIEDEQIESSRRTWYKIITELNGERIEGWMASNTLNN